MNFIAPKLVWLVLIFSAVVGAAQQINNAALIFTNYGIGATAAPTTATASFTSVGATCSGTATVSTTVGAPYTITNYSTSGSGGDGLPGWSAKFST